MTLRRTSTAQPSHPRRLRRLRLACALALASSTLAPAMAQTPLPKMSKNALANMAAEAELLPYPFSVRGEAERRATSQRLVGLLGMRRQSVAIAPAYGVQLAAAAVSLPEAPPASLPACQPSGSSCAAESESCTAATPKRLPPMPKVDVVPAAATAAEETNQATAAVSLPSLPQASAGVSLTLHDTPPAEPASGSLIDIQIPLKLADSQAKTSQPPTAATSSPAAAINLAFSDTADSPAADSPTTRSSGSDRQPELVRTNKAMTLTIEPAAGTPTLTLPTAAKPAPSAKPATGTVQETVELNFADDVAASPDASFSLSDGTASQGVQLHLSSASPAKIAPRGSQPASAIAQADKPPTGLRLPQFPGTLHLSSSPVTSATQTTQPISSQRELAPATPLTLAAEPTIPEAGSRSANGELELGMLSRPTQPIQTKRTSAVLASRTTALPAETGSSMPKEVSQGAELQIELHEVVSLTAARVAEISVEQPDICQLLKTSDTTLSLVGLKAGSTRIAIITHNAQGQSEVEVREVTVSSRPNTTRALAPLARDIAQTVSQVYPNSDVQIVAHDDHLLVRGMATSESEARKIVTLVRKTSLMPVKDEVKAYGR